MKTGRRLDNRSSLKRAALFLGLKRSMVGMLAMVILCDMGERMAERFLPIYLMAIGGGAISIGLLNGLDNLLSALYAYPGGFLSERLGAKRALIIFNLIAMFGFAIVVAVPDWRAVIIGALFFISWSAISLPATMSLINRALPSNKLTMGVSMHSLVRRIPMALGPLIGGAFIAAWGERDGIRYAFIGAIAMAFAAMILQQILIEPDSPKEKSQVATPRKSMLARMTPQLRLLLVSDILVRFCEQIPYAFVVVWCMKTIEHPVSAIQFGALTTIEMATAILIYIPVAALADKSGKKPFVVATFLFFSVFPLILYFSHSFWWLVVAFIVRGLKEFGEPTRKALIMELAPEDCKAAMFGFYYLSRDMVVSLAAFGGAFLWIKSPAVNLFTAFAFGIIGALWFSFFGRDLEKRENRSL